MSQTGQEPAKWAVVVGINGYHESLGTLAYCVDDARLLCDTLVSACAFPETNVLLLADDEPQDRQPTYGNIHSWLAAWLGRPGPDDLTVVYFACHGREVGGKVLLAPLDATLDSLHVTGIPIGYVHDLLDRCQARQKVLILDTCHSGAGRDIEGMSPEFRAAIDRDGGLYSIASCDAHQISYEWPDKGHGVFTHYLAEAIRDGAPPQPNGDVTLDAVYAWTTTRVTHWAATRRLSQNPVRCCRTTGQIVIANRSLTLERRLSAAQEQVAEQQADLDRLAAECEALRRKLDEAVGANLVFARPSVHRRLCSTARANTRFAPAEIVPTRVPEWREWARRRVPHRSFYVVAYLVSAVLVGPLVGLAAFGAAAFLRLPEPVLVAVLAALALPCLIAVRQLSAYRRCRNTYRLVCAERCAEAGDYVGGAGFALPMGRLGIDPAAAGAILVRLAGLALDNGDVRCARSLYRRARRRWRSPYARDALKALAARATSREKSGNEA